MRPLPIIPPGFIDQIKGLLNTISGKNETIDCFLNRMADQLVNPGEVPTGSDHLFVPTYFKDLINKPTEVIDFLLTKLEDMWVFRYLAKVFEYPDGSFLVLVSDQESTHILEEITGVDKDKLIGFLFEKYGKNFEVIKE